MVKIGDKRRYIPETGGLGMYRDFPNVTAELKAITRRASITPLEEDSDRPSIEVPIGTYACWVVDGPRPTHDCPHDYPSWLAELLETAEVRFTEDFR